MKYSFASAVGYIVEFTQLLASPLRKSKRHTVNTTTVFGGKSTSVIHKFRLGKSSNLKHQSCEFQGMWMLMASRPVIC